MCTPYNERQWKYQRTADMNRKIPENQKYYYGQADKCTCSAMSIYSEEYKVTGFLLFAHPPGLVC